jgi:hypothetical protein
MWYLPVNVVRGNILCGWVMADASCILFKRRFFARTQKENVKFRQLMCYRYSYPWLSQPLVSSPLLSKKAKKGESEDLRLSDVYFFLSISTITAPTTAIAAMMPPIPGSRYWSAIEAGGAVGATVGSGASITPKAVSVYEGQ